MTKPNVLLLIMDSLRARNCSVYGYERETTPFLSEFAEGSVKFEQARSPSIHSISSHASIFTGYHTEEHNITEHKSFVNPEATIWNTLSVQYDYETGLFTPNAVVTLTSNLGDCFDEYVGPKRVEYRLFKEGLTPLDVQGDLTASEYLKTALSHEAPIRSVLNGVYKKYKSREGAHDPDSENASVYVKEFLDWVKKVDSPWGACINLMDTHTPFNPTPEYDLWTDDDSDKQADGKNIEPFTEAYWDRLGKQISRYDGTIREADAAAEALVNELSEIGVLDDTLIVITSDHGEGFGELSELDKNVRLRHHSWGIDEVLTHVPLIVLPPDGTEGREIPQPATLTRFPRVVKDTVDENVEDPVSGFVPEQDVVSSTYRIKPPGDELDLPESERQKYFGPWRSVYRMTDDGVLKYARRGDDAVTLKIPDAQDSVEVSTDDDGVVEEVFSSFQDEGVKFGSAGNRDIDTEVESRLEDLGYLR